MESFCVWGGGFTKDECQKIRDLGVLFSFKQARVGGDGQDIVKEHVRETDIAWIEPNKSTEFIFQRMDQLASYMNWKSFQLDLTCFDGFQFGMYKPGGHYDWHVDTFEQPHDGLYRKLSFVVMLSDPDEYEGGDLLISRGGNNDKAERHRLKRGDVAMFYSHLPHKVEPVTSGTRISMVTWAKGPKIA